MGIEHPNPFQEFYLFEIYNSIKQITTYGSSDFCVLMDLKVWKFEK